jgi:hypothetical protein
MAGVVSWSAKAAGEIGGGMVKRAPEIDLASSENGFLFTVTQT